MDLPVPFPIRPMLAKATKGGLPEGGHWVYEPKWDGFRCIVFRDGEHVELGSRNERPLTRYFPEMLDPLRRALPERCVVDGEILVVVEGRLDFDALGQRIHPAASRVDMLARSTPATFVAFDLLAVDDRSLLDAPFDARRRTLIDSVEQSAVVRVTPLTEDRAVALEWFHRFEGAGLDGLIAKDPSQRYEPDKRAMVKVKHQRTADCVVAGYRVHKDGRGVGSLLLGLHDDDGKLNHVGVAASFSAKRRSELVDEIAPFEDVDLSEHPWGSWADEAAHVDGRMPGAPSRWNAQKNLSWIPLRPELVVEVRYSILTHGRFRGVTAFVRWRPDKAPEECAYRQLEVVETIGFDEVVGV